MKFTGIDYELTSGNNLKLSAEYEGRILVVVELSKDRLAELYPKEVGTQTIEWWYQEFMSQQRANKMFASASIDEITEVVTNS